MVASLHMNANMPIPGIPATMFPDISKTTKNREWLEKNAQKQHILTSHRNILKKKYLLNFHFLLIFKLKKVKNILYSKEY